MAERVRHALRHPYSLLPGAPSGVIHSSRQWVADWLQRHPTDIRRGPAAAWQEVDAPSWASWPKPRSVQAGRGQALRVFPVPGTALVFLKGARLLGAEGVVISPDNRVFSEFTYVDEAQGIHAHSVFRRRRFPSVKPLAGWYATLAYPSGGAYYHWLTECLPRLRLLEPQLAGLDGVFVPHQLPRPLVEALGLWGLRPEQLIALDMMSHVAPEHLLVPQYCAGLDLPAWLAPYLRARVLGPAPLAKPSRRIYVSRQGVSRRRVLNEADLIGVLQARGFELVRPETLSFVEQARLFSQAEVVVGSTGAGLTNALFCQPGASLVTLMPHSGMPPHSFYSLASAAGLHYWDLCGAPQLQAGQALNEHVDFVIDAGELAATLDAIVRAAPGP